MAVSEDFPRERLSLCMIVRNEAEKLGRCLISAAPWVGEMIIVDTGSTDDTVAIAESFGAKVVHFQWCDDFAAARNAGLEHATCHWVLVLDADEELVVELPEVWALLLQKDSPHRFHVRVRNSQELGKASWAPVLRLFTREQPGARFRSRIHEHLPAVSGVHVEQGILEGVWLRHDGYTHKATLERRKVERNVALSRLQVAEAPDDPHAWWCLATSLPPSQAIEAVECFEKALQLLGRGPEVRGPLLASIYALGATAMQNAGLYGRAEEMLNEGLEIFPGYPDLLLQRGGIYLNSGRFERAERDFFAARSEAGRHYHLRFSDPHQSTVGARVGRGHALIRLGRVAEAEAEWLGAIPLVTPETASPLVPLAQLRMEAQAWQEALDFLEREMARVTANLDVKILAVRCLLELGQMDRAWELLIACEDSSAVLGYRVQILLLQGHAEQALQMLEREAHSSEAFWLSAWANICCGQHERAVEVWRLARQGELQVAESGLLPLALHFFADEALPEDYPLLLPALVEFVRGVRYLIRCQRFDELEAVIEKGRRLPLELWRPLRGNLGKQLAFDGFADVGLELLVDALQDEPNQPEILYWAGFAALQMTYLEDARTFWEACVAIAPEHSLAKQGLEMLPQSPVPLVS